MLVSVAALPKSKLAESVSVTNGEALYEVIHGERVELPPMSIYSARLGTRFATRMDLFAEQNGLGTVVCEGLFILDAKLDLRRRPDVAFVSKERWPLNKPLPETGDWLLSPDLAVEVSSPNDLLQDFYEKLEAYFKYQVRQVWLVLPPEKAIFVYTSPTQSRKLTIDMELDGGDVLPGFRLSLAELFNQPTAHEPRQ